MVYREKDREVLVELSELAIKTCGNCDKCCLKYSENKGCGFIGTPSDWNVPALKRAEHRTGDNSYTENMRDVLVRIKKHCSKQVNCTECEFLGTDKECSFKYGPELWELPVCTESSYKIHRSELKNSDSQQNVI